MAHKFILHIYLIKNGIHLHRYPQTWCGSLCFNKTRKENSKLAPKMFKIQQTIASSLKAMRRRSRRLFCPLTFLSVWIFLTWKLRIPQKLILSFIFNSVQIYFLTGCVVNTTLHCMPIYNIDISDNRRQYPLSIIFKRCSA